MWKARLQSYLSLGIVLFIIFMLVGDRFLPQPFNTASQQTRTIVTRFVLGFFPQWQPKTSPYRRTEDAIQREEGSK